MSNPQVNATAAKLVRTLGADQLKLAVFMAMPSKLRPDMATIAREIGVSDTTIWNWRQDPEFELVRRELVRAYFIAYVPDVIEAQRKKAVDLGDTAAARLFLEFVKELKEVGAGTTNIHVHMTNEEVADRLDELNRKVPVPLPEAPVIEASFTETEPPHAEEPEAPR